MAQGQCSPRGRSGAGWAPAKRGQSGPAESGILRSGFIRHLRDTTRNMSVKRAVPDSPIDPAPPGKAAKRPATAGVIARLYVGHSCYGEAPVYQVYTTSDPGRSARVHAAMKALHALSAKKSVPYVTELLAWLEKHRSVADAEAEIADETHAPNKTRMTLAFDQFKTIGDEGREDDAFVIFANNDANSPTEFGTCYEAHPLQSVLCYYWNY